MGRPLPIPALRLRRISVRRGARVGTYLVADFTTLSVDESAEAVPYPSPLELRSGEVWVYLRYEGPLVSG
jgi:hypothetical protein